MEHEPITKKLIAERDRLDTLPRYLGKHFLTFEQSVYAFMDRFCDGYNGGYWDFYALGNGGFFMCLSGEHIFNVTNPYNYFEEEMSSEAVSVGVNLYALNTVIWDNPQESGLVDLYDRLRDYACEVPGESGKILAFID